MIGAFYMNVYVRSNIYFVSLVTIRLVRQKVACVFVSCYLYRIISICLHFLIVQRISVSVTVFADLNASPHNITREKFFNCYLAVPRPTLGHFRGDSFINPMLITAFSTISTRMSPGAS